MQKMMIPEEKETKKKRKHIFNKLKQSFRLEEMYQTIVIANALEPNYNIKVRPFGCIISEAD